MHNLFNTWVIVEAAILKFNPVKLKSHPVNMRSIEKGEMDVSAEI
jgi:hypothetical protein